MDTIKQLLQSRAVLVALWAFIRALITAFAPGVPQTVMVSADGLVAVIITVIAVSDARGRAREVNAMRESSEMSVCAALGNGCACMAVRSMAAPPAT